MFRIRRFLTATLWAVVSSVPATAQAPSPNPQPTCIENVTVGLPSEGGDGAAKVNVILRAGRIETILSADAPIPTGVKRIDGDGLIALPAFIDAYTHTGIETPQPTIDQDVPVDTGAGVRIDMRRANRKGIEPSFRAAANLKIDADASKAWREAGFGAAHVAPGGQLLSGTTCVASTRDAAMRDLVIRPDAFAAAAFTATGDGYPSTLMGFTAQLRQFFLDATRQSELEQRYEAGRPGLRPPFDEELDAGREIVAGNRVVLCDSSSYRDVERWMRLADELGFHLAISGGGKDAWRVAERLAERDIPVFLTLDWGKEVKDPLAKDKKKEKKEAKEGEGAAKPEQAAPEQPGEPEVEGVEGVEEVEAAEAAAAPEVAAEEASAQAAEGEQQEQAAEKPAAEEAKAPERDWQYEEPLGVRVERRREWEEARDTALRLSEAGVRLAFGTGREKPDKLLGKVRELIEAGMKEDTALAALTTNAAEMLGVGKRLGKLEPGYDATLTLWTADPLTDKKAKAAWIFVDGFPTRFDLPKEGEKGTGEGPAEGVDATGTWKLVVSGGNREPRDITLQLEMAEDGAVTGTELSTNRDGSERSVDVSGRVDGKTLRLEGSFDMRDSQVEYSYELTLDGDALSGDVTYHFPFSPEPRVMTVDGKREPQTAR